MSDSQETTKTKRRRRRMTVRHQRSFAAAENDRLLADFRGTSLSMDEELTGSLRKMRMRSRQLSQDNDYIKRYLSMVRGNVVGPRGIMLQARTKKQSGELDTADNDYIEREFVKWGKPRHCTVSERLSWYDVQNLFIESVARDGEALCLFVYGKQYQYGMSLQMLDVDYLDETYNTKLNNGNVIRMGIEQDRYGAAVAYHLLSNHPGEPAAYTHEQKKYIRVPAERVIHAFRTERAGQSRGVPWTHTAIRRLKQMAGMEEAELVASRVAASKMGFFTSDDGEGYVGSDLEDGEEDDGAMITDVEPGVLEQLPDGVSFQSFDPQHPTSAFEPFIKTELRGAASGLDVAYTSLANDLTDVNFSSIRSGTLEERDQWRQKQAWMIGQFLEPVYNKWLRHSIVSGALRLPAAKIEKFEEVTFLPRSWAWVDPLKDMKANELAYNLRTISLSEIAEAQGKNFEDVVERIRKERELLDAAGITVQDMQEELNDDDKE